MSTKMSTKKDLRFKPENQPRKKPLEILRTPEEPVMSIFKYASGNNIPYGVPIIARIRLDLYHIDEHVEYREILVRFRDIQQLFLMEGNEYSLLYVTITDFICGHNCWCKRIICCALMEDDPNIRCHIDLTSCSFYLGTEEAIEDALFVDNVVIDEGLPVLNQINEITEFVKPQKKEDVKIQITASERSDDSTSETSSDEEKNKGKDMKRKRKEVNRRSKIKKRE